MLHYSDDHLDVHIGDCREVLRSLSAESVHCVVTSPPYWGLRDYGVEGALGLEPTPEAFIASMVEVFREVRRVLRRDGTLWLNMGDSYAQQGGVRTPNTFKLGESHEEGKSGFRTPASGQAKQLMGMPWRLAFALQADGWYLRSDIIWSKPNPMPESVTDRPTKSHEYVFLLTKSARYFYDADAVREQNVTQGDRREGNGRFAYDGKYDGTRDDGTQQAFVTINPAGRNLRSVWQIATEPYPGAHFATFPQKLVEPCIKAGTSERGVCPECGAPWVREVETELAPPARAWSPPNKGRVGDFLGERAAALTASGWVPNRDKTVTTTGWRPSCGHTQEPRTKPHPGSPYLKPVPATVLDPFAGSGTTGLVANRLGRRAILIDLSADYIDQAMLRNQQAPLGML